MDRVRRFLSRHQMALFVLLTLLISWSVVIPMDGTLIPHGPMIAAFIVLAIVVGRNGPGRLWRQMSRWRVHWKWYLIAPGLIIVPHLLALTLHLLLGARVVDTAHLRSLPAYLALVAPLLIAGGQWEEPGWMGYVLHRFQQRYPHAPLVAIAAAGAFRMFWHTPLLLYGWIPWYDFLFGTFALHIVLTWLYNSTRGSVLITMLCHFSSNLLMATMLPLFTTTAREQYWLLYTITMPVTALVLLLATRGGLGSTPPGKPGPLVAPQ